MSALALSKSSISIQRVHSLLVELLPIVGQVKDAVSRGKFYAALLQFSEQHNELFEPKEKEILSDCQAAKQFAAVANFLNQKPIKRGAKDAENLELKLSTAEAFYLSRNTSQADAALLIAKNYKLDRVSPVPLLIRYYNLVTNIQITKRNYQEAAQSLYNLSLLSNIPENDQKESLKRSLRLALLAPNQSLIVSRLLDDSRSTSFSAFPLLEGLKKKQIITDKQLESLWNELQTEESVQKNDLEKQIRQHNLIQISRLYSTISYGQLSKILKISETDALSMVSDQIINGQLKAVIDQPAEFVIFTVSERNRDEDIRTYCSLVESASRLIK